MNLYLSGFQLVFIYFNFMNSSDIHVTSIHKFKSNALPGDKSNSSLLHGFELHEQPSNPPRVNKNRRMENMQTCWETIALQTSSLCREPWFGSPPPCRELEPNVHLSSGMLACFIPRKIHEASYQLFIFYGGTWSHGRCDSSFPGLNQRLWQEQQIRTSKSISQK